MTASLRR